MQHEIAAQSAAVLGGVGALLVLVPPRRPSLLAGFFALAVAEALLAYALVPGDDLRRLGSPLGAVALAAGAALGALLTLAFVRRPGIVPLALLVVAPFRLPLEVGDQRAFLLVPLYAVLGAGVLALTVRAVRGEPIRSLPLPLGAAAGVYVALAGASFLWTDDPRAGAISLGFFLFPFVALLAVVARSPLPRRLPRAAAAILVTLACLFAVIGLSQLWTKRLFFAEDLEVANTYTSYFRVTSLFKDPSLYGRHLVIAIAVLLVALLLGRSRIAVVAPVVGLLFAGLFFSYSQSSMLTLATVTLAVALVAGDRRVRLVVGSAAAVIVLAAGGVVAASVHGEPAKRATSGRSTLATAAADVFAAHPVVGVGIGGQARASAEEVRGGEGVRRSVSHATPLTVAAELGSIGLLAYLGFLAAAAAALIAVHKRNPALGLGLGAAFLALVVHSLFYSGFFEDPIAWGVLGLVCAALAVLPARASVPVRQPAAPTPATASASVAGRQSPTT